MMESKASTSSPAIMTCPVIVRKDFQKLLCSVKEISQVTTINEILDTLRVYLWEKKLFLAADPTKISCQEDELSSVLGRTEFSLTDIIGFIPKLIYPTSKDTTITTASIPVSASPNKRKHEEETDDASKKSRLCLGSHSPMILQIPPSPKYMSSDTSESLQGYETTFVKDSTDETYYSDEKEFDYDMFTTEKLFSPVLNQLAIRYELDSSDEDSIHSSGVLFPDPELVIVGKDSDREFWADKSSDEDYNSEIEIAENDRWKCNKCGSFNSPPNRFCQKCFNTRAEWLAEQSEKRQKPRRKPRSKRKKAATKKKTDTNSKEELSSSQSTLPSTSQENLCLDISNELNITTQQKLCQICNTRNINASIIHGKFAHTICCYPCGRQLQVEKQRCPVCQRTIDRIVYQVS